MPTFYTDEFGARFEVVRDAHGEAHLVPIEDEQPEPEAPVPRERPARSWADVYRVESCGACGKSDCPRCAAKFLSFLAERGTSRATG